MEAISKEKTYIDFLEVVNNATDPEVLLNDTFQIVYNCFRLNNINRVQLWKPITNSNEMSIYFEHCEKKEKSMIKYRINSLPESLKRSSGKNKFLEYLNINDNFFKDFNISSFFGIELSFSESENAFLILTSKDKNIKLTDEERGFLSGLVHQLETGIAKTRKLHKNNDEVKRLKYQNLTLREQEALRTNLINNISHEFRTPLSSILGFSNLLLKKPHSEEYVKETAEQIQQAANRLSSMLSDFLQANKTVIELWTPKIDPCDIGEIIKTSVEEFAILNRGHKLCYNISDNYPIINTDQKLVRLIMDNLISNAIKYSPNGGTISVSLERPKNKKEIIISVCDKGIGISKEELSKIFSRFYRSSNPKIQGITGSGLGLAICKEIITSLNGKIEVKSEPDKGSTFTFTLPVQ